MYYTDLPYEIDDRCPHRHVKLFSRGNRSFNAGEVWDDIEDQYVCLDCWKTLSITEVRAVWHGQPILAPNPRRKQHYGH